MEWYVTLALILGSLLFLLIVLRVPVFVALLGIGLVILIAEYGWTAASRQVPLGFAASLSLQTLAPVPLFFLMGEVLFRTGMVERAINSITLALDRLPGKLSASATSAGAVLGIVSGSATATTALLGKNLIPEMRKYEYKPGLAIGSIMSAGGLSMVLPPSTVIVVLGATAQIPIGPLLIAGLIPGLLMVAGYFVLQTIWVLKFNGDGTERAHMEGVVRPSFWQRTKELPSSLLPLIVIFALVLGLILFGIATPTESAAFGVLAAVLFAAVQRRLSLKLLWESAKSTTITAGSLLLLIAAAGSFSQALAASGVLPGFLRLFNDLEAPTPVILILLLLITVFLGLFLESMSIIMITAPFFVPIIAGLGVDSIWFGVLWLIALRIGLVTPPFGLELFVMRRVAPMFSMGTIYKAAVPFVASDVIVMALIFVFPVLATALVAVG
ncbi:TRAP transporter large permease subunit [Microbacterium album]|uniref:Tripartite transporter large subunit n=1 Tax=Microbacterium album TaxID=2053191 RepID=A0A917IGR7_9MICO|nr:TRAP transporter large permease subunit [Microbacterium album]GGH47448.1 tripartite transporter large subunit [Microbacterium album]